MTDNRKTIKEQLEAIRPHIVIRTPAATKPKARKPRTKKESGDVGSNS
jgi:hypothetical protein